MSTPFAASFLDSGGCRIQVVVAVAVTPFAEWLERQMRLNEFGDNQSKLATYLRTGRSTVNKWFTRGTVPGPAMCRRLAALFKMPVDDVLAAAGHIQRDPPPAEMPSWFAELAPLVKDFDEYEKRSLEASVLQLRELHSLRGAYEANQPEA